LPNQSDYINHYGLSLYLVDLYLDLGFVVFRGYRFDSFVSDSAYWAAVVLVVERLSVLVVERLSVLVAERLSVLVAERTAALVSY